MCQKYLSPFEGGGPALKPLVRGLTCFHDGFPRTLFLLLRSHRWQLFFSFHTTFYLVGGKVAITVFSPPRSGSQDGPGSDFGNQPTGFVQTEPCEGKAVCFLFTRGLHGLVAWFWLACFSIQGLRVLFVWIICKGFHLYRTGGRYERLLLNGCTVCCFILLSLLHISWQK